MKNHIPPCRTLFAISVLLCTLYARAQDNQYWTQQNGARATLMGGAASASIDDQAVLFYNPAAARRVKGTGITASANFMYMQWLQVKDLEGLGLDAKESASNNAPKLLVGSFDPKGNARLRISFGFVNNLYGRFEVKQSAAVRVETDPDRPGAELATAFVNINTTSREDLAGGGASYTLGEHGSIGVNIFASLFSQDYQNIRDLGIFADPSLNDTAGTLAARTINEQVDIFNIGLLAKLGYFHVNDRTQWGVTLTVPRMDLIANAGSYYSSTTTVSADGTSRKELLFGEELTTSFRTPWMVDIGVETKAGTSVWALRVGVASVVNAYDRMFLRAADDLAQGALAPANPSYRRVRSASVPVVNVGVGGQFRLSENADLLAGLRTDMNHLDLSELDPSTDITGTFSYWNLYHMSCGVDWHSTRAKFTAGLVYSVGRDTSSPRDFAAIGKFIPAVDDVRFKTNFNQLGLTFGISYFVLGKDQAKPTQ
jgi:long-subunit fatty acid transport protein